MNILFSLVCILFFVWGAIGYARGALKSVIALGVMIVAVVLTNFFYPALSKALQKNENVKKKVERSIREKLDVAEDGHYNSKAEQVAAINDLKVPQIFKNSLLENNTKDVKGVIGADTFVDYIVKLLGRLVINGIAYAITFAILLILVAIGTIVLKLFHEISVFNLADRIGGAAIGFVKALIVTWIAFIIIDCSLATEFGTKYSAMIHENGILTMLYDNNILKAVVMDLTKTVL